MDKTIWTHCDGEKTTFQNESDRFFPFFLGGQTCCEHAAATGPAGEGGPAHLQGQQEKGIVVFRGAYCMSNTS